LKREVIIPAFREVVTNLGETGGNGNVAFPVELSVDPESISLARDGFFEFAQMAIAEGKKMGTKSRRGGLGQADAGKN
jgi:hypothetical protein